MITVPTALILGAGASVSYNYPSGSRLREDIINLLDRSFSEWENVKQNGKPINVDEVIRDYHNLLCFLHYNCGFDIEFIIQFKDDFVQSGMYSIDAFLEHRTEYSDIGKLMIARCLYGAEHIPTLYSLVDSQKVPNWYMHLFNEMNAPLETFHLNRLVVITYNYDRSFEQFLFGSIKAKFRISDEECAKLVGKFPIIHLHGSIGKPSYEPGGKPYHYDVYPGDLSEAAASLHIIHEDEKFKEAYARAHDELYKVDQIFILGFGFDQRNLERLDLARYNSKPIVSTRYGISNLNVLKINKRTANSILFTPDKQKGIVSLFDDHYSLDGFSSKEIMAFNRNMRSERDEKVEVTERFDEISPETEPMPPVRNGLSMMGVG